MGTGSDREITEGQRDGATHANVGQRIDGIRSALGGDRVERHDGVAGAAAIDREDAALKGHGVGGRDSGGRGAGRGVEAEVIPIERAVEELEAGGAGDGAAIA